MLVSMQMNLSALAYQRVLKLARIIADLADEKDECMIYRQFIAITVVE
jgi:predicted ATPase with chaperone activity